MGCSNATSISISSTDIRNRAQTKEFMSLYITAPCEILIKRNALFEDLLKTYIKQHPKSQTIPFNQIDLTDRSDPSNYIILYKGEVQEPNTPLPNKTLFSPSDIVIKYNPKQTDLEFTIQNMNGSIAIPVRCPPETKMKVLIDLCKEILAYEDNRIEYEFKHKQNTLNENLTVGDYRIAKGDVIHFVIKSTKPPEVTDNERVQKEGEESNDDGNTEEY